MKTQPLPETLHNYGPSPTTSSNVAGVKGMEMSLLERHTLSIKHQQEQLLQLHPQLQQICFSDLSLLPFLSPQLHDFRGLNMGSGPDPSLTRPIKPDPGSENSWADFEMAKSGIDSVGQVDSCSSYGVVKCQPLMVARVESEIKERGSLVIDKKPGLKKRKPEMSQALEGNAEENSMSKKSKDCVEEEESKNTEQNSDRKVNNANKNDRTKSNKDSKPDYIHVRARRGQATDSHSLAERVRREKISERMKYLQDLVPGCNKITGKAGMLDEIINYVQSLQRQVEFLSMKLAAVNPSLDFNIDDLIAREVFTDCSTSMPTMGVCQEMTDPNYLQYNPIQQMDQVCGSEPSINPIDMGLRRTIDAHVSVSVPETFIDHSYLSQISSSLPWHADLQNIYNMEFQQERSTLFPLLPFAGTIETSNLKMEM